MKACHKIQKRLCSAETPSGTQGRLQSSHSREDAADFFNVCSGLCFRSGLVVGLSSLLPVSTMNEFACGASRPRRSLQTRFPNTTVKLVFRGKGSRSGQFVRACREEACQQDPLLSGSVRSANAAMLIHASTMVEAFFPHCKGRIDSSAQKGSPRCQQGASPSPPG